MEAPYNGPTIFAWLCHCALRIIPDFFLPVIAIKMKGNVRFRDHLKLEEVEPDLLDEKFYVI